MLAAQYNRSLEKCAHFTLHLRNILREKSIPEAQRLLSWQRAAESGDHSGCSRRCLQCRPVHSLEIQKALGILRPGCRVDTRGRHQPSRCNPDHAQGSITNNIALGRGLKQCLNVRTYYSPSANDWGQLVACPRGDAVAAIKQPIILIAAAPAVLPVCCGGLKYSCSACRSASHSAGLIVSQTDQHLHILQMNQ